MSLPYTVYGDDILDDNNQEIYFRDQRHSWQPDGPGQASTYYYPRTLLKSAGNWSYGDLGTFTAALDSIVGSDTSTSAKFNVINGQNESYPTIPPPIGTQSIGQQFNYPTSHDIGAFIAESQITPFSSQEQPENSAIANIQTSVFDGELNSSLEYDSYLHLSNNTSNVLDWSLDIPMQIDSNLLGTSNFSFVLDGPNTISSASGVELVPYLDGQFSATPFSTEVLSIHEPINMINPSQFQIPTEQTATSVQNTYCAPEHNLIDLPQCIMPNACISDLNCSQANNLTTPGRTPQTALAQQDLFSELRFGAQLTNASESTMVLGGQTYGACDVPMTDMHQHCQDSSVPKSVDAATYSPTFGLQDLPSSDVHAHNANTNPRIQSSKVKGDEGATPISKSRDLVIKRIARMPAGGLMMTTALHGKRIQKRNRLSAEAKERKLHIRRVGACLPCKLDGKMCERPASVSHCRRCSTRYVEWTWSPCLTPLDINLSTLSGTPESKEEVQAALKIGDKLLRSSLPVSELNRFAISNGLQHKFEDPSRIVFYLIEVLTHIDRKVGPPHVPLLWSIAAEFIQSDYEGSLLVESCLQYNLCCCYVLANDHARNRVSFASALFQAAGYKITAMLKATIGNAKKKLHLHPCIALSCTLIFSGLSIFLLYDDDKTVPDSTADTFNALIKLLLLSRSGLAPLFTDTQHLDTKVRKSYELVKDGLIKYILTATKALDQERGVDWAPKIPSFLIYELAEAVVTSILRLVCSPGYIPESGVFIKPLPIKPPPV